MQDEPTIHELIDIVARFLRETVAPRLDNASAYEARVAASLLATVQRQLSRPSDRDTKELERLRALLTQDKGDVLELTGVLCERIRSGAIGWNDPALLQHLWDVALDKIEVDQPTYSTYRRIVHVSSHPHGPPPPLAQQIP